MPHASGVSETTLRVDEEELTYSGGDWRPWSVSGAFGDDTMYSWDKNATASYAFTGTQVKLFGSKFYNAGKVAVSVDDGPETVVDLYSETSQHQVDYYSSEILADGPHTIRMRNTGTKNDRSHGYSLHTDRLDVVQPDTTTTSSTTTIPSGTSTPVPIEVYGDGSIGPGWENWSWDTAVNFSLNKGSGAIVPSSGVPPRAIGRSSIAVRHLAGFGGLNLHNRVGQPISGYHALTLFLRTDPGSSVNLTVVLLDENSRVSGVAVPLADVANAATSNGHHSTFRRYDLRLAEDFRFTGTRIKGIQIKDVSGAATSTYYVDEIMLTPRLDDNCTVPAPQGGFEARPENDVVNRQPGGPLPPLNGADIFDDREFLFEHDYYPYINGECQGTTEQIIEWAARKWGFADVAAVNGGPPLNRLDAVKAQVLIESDWFQNIQGDFHCGASGPNGMAVSYGIIGVKNSVCDGSNNNWKNSFPRSLRSTALALDYAYAGIRAHYDCAIHWTCWDGMSDLSGNARVNAAMRAWYCGCGPDTNDPIADQYVLNLLHAESSKPWVNDPAWRSMRW